MSLEVLKTIFEVGGVILLFFTFIFGAGLVLTTNKLNDRQAEQLREFDSELTEAKRKLGEQQERAAKADARVAGLETDAANAKGEMAIQETRAANAEMALLELQQRLAHRRISPTQHNEFVAILAPHRGSTVHMIKLNDPEASVFAHDIIDVLRDAGWSVQLTPAAIVSPPPYGLLCSIDTDSPAGLALTTVLSSLPTPKKIHRAAMQQGLVGVITVGLKFAP